VGPLHGAVFAIKDQYDTFDMRTTSGADVPLRGIYTYKYVITQIQQFRILTLFLGPFMTLGLPE